MPEPATDRPPGPPGRKLVGNTYDYDLDRIGFLRRCHEQYGDVFSFSPLTIFVSDPELINELFMETNGNYLFDEPLFDSDQDLQQMLDNLDGWMRARKVAWRGMTKSMTRAHGDRVVAELNRTLHEQDGREFDPVPVMRDSSIRLVAEFVFGPDSQDVVEATDVRSKLAVQYMRSNLTFPKWFPSPKVRRAVRAQQALISAVQTHIRRRRDAPRETPEDMLDLFFADGLADAPSEAEMTFLLTSTMLASFGSPGSSMSWLIRELIRHPEIRRRLREEALALRNETGALLDDRKLSYSRAFVNEILRLYPPTWVIGRRVRRPCTLGGWSLQPGQKVMFSPYLMHRDARWWSEPDELRPERWLGAGPKSLVPHTYFPFGAGPRICLGMHLGAYQLVTAASHLAAHYSLESTTAEQVEATTDAILLPRGLRVRITPAEPTQVTRSGEPAERTTAEVTS